MDFLTSLAEQRIQEAIRRGELDNLSLKGRPIPKEDFSDVPEELRMGFHLLKNAGYLPEELELNREILSLKNLLDTCRDEEEQTSLRRKISEKRLRFNIMMEKNIHNPAFRRYSDKLLNRLGLS